MRTYALLSCALAALALAPAAHGQETCGVTAVPLERQLRQLYLDLLQRPPTVEEYDAARAKGTIDAADVRALMEKEEFYARMREYHRALFRANVAGSVYNNNDTKLFVATDGAKPLESRGTPTRELRGRTGTGCDHFVPQADCNLYRQDPHLEPATKTCFDENGVPLPVSVDYDTSYYVCTRLDQADATLTSCEAAVSQGAIPDKHLYFCDLRRDTAGKLHPHLCLPDPNRPATQVLTQEVLEPGTGRVVAFANPNPSPTAAYNQLDRCGLALGLRNGLKGSYLAQRGCLQREGYVMTAPPFWDTRGLAQVASCAIEAQDRAFNPVTLQSCEGARFMNDRSCGCGERFRRCESGDGSVHARRVEALNEEPLWITDSVIRRGEDYFNVLTTRRSFINGPLSALLHERQGTGVFAVSAPVELEAVPKLPFDADPKVWKEYVRAEHHAGVLTTPAFLLRFPTQRSRVNEFYEALLCKSFVPPQDVALPAPDDACNRENNLSQRCGCSYCHATIEPTGAHWGRYGERNAIYLDPARYPRFDPKCRDCALNGNVSCDGECDHYVMQAADGEGAQSLGLLKTYLYRTPEEEPNIAGGPRLLVEQMLQTGELERCTVRRLWAELLGRPMSSEEERLYLTPLVDGFVRDGRSVKALIERIVTTDAYRRID